MTTTRAAFTATRPRYAALCDLDNILISDRQLLHTSAAAEVLDAVDWHTTDMPTRAVCGWSILRSYLPLLANRPWGLSAVSPTPDAADWALVEDGRRFVAAGVTDLVVISGDRFFAQLARDARLHVITARGCLSRELRLAATSVTYLPQTAHTPGGAVA